MPWANDPEARRRSAQTYGTSEYRRLREEARRQANGICAGCGCRHSKLEFDAKIPVSQGGDHGRRNGRMLCKGPGTCQCHEKKTAREGGGWRSAPDPAPAPRTRW